MILTAFATLLKIFGFNLSSRAVSFIFYGLIAAVLALAGFGVYKVIDNNINQGKKDAATIGKLENQVDTLGKSVEGLTQVIDDIALVEEIKSEVNVQAKQNSDVSNTKTEKIIENKNRKIKDIVEKHKTPEPTKESVILKEKEVTTVVINSMWDAFCKDNETDENCRG